MTRERKCAACGSPIDAPQWVEDVSHYSYHATCAFPALARLLARNPWADDPRPSDWSPRLDEPPPVTPYGLDPCHGQ